MVDMARVQRNLDKLQAAGYGEDQIADYLQSEGLSPADMGIGQPAPQLEGRPDPTMSGGLLSGLSDVTLGLGPKLLAAGQTLPNVMDGLDAWNQAYGEQAQSNIDAMREYREENPLTALTGAILGGVGTGSAIQGLARLPATLATATGLGVAEGGLIGAGESQPGQELPGAVQGSAIGGFFGPVGYGIGQGVQRGVNFALNQATGRGAEEFALRKIGEKIDTDQARAMMGEYGDKPFTLADVNEQARGLARGATSLQGPGRDIGIPAMEARMETRVPRALEDLRQTMMQGVDEPITELGPAMTRRIIANERRAASNPLYRQYVDEFGDVPLTDELRSFLQTPAARMGIRAAQESAGNRRVAPMTLRTDPETGEILDGQVTFRDLDMIQRGMRLVVDANTDPVTGNLAARTGTMDPVGIRNAREDFVDLLERINPNYNQARRTYADYSAQERAFIRGQNIFREDFGDMGMDIDDLSPQEREMFTRGVFSSFRNRHSTLSDPSSRATWNYKKRELINRVMEPEQAALLTELVQRERNLAKTEQAIVGGSPTARITEELTDMMIDPETMSNVVLGGPEAIGRLAMHPAVQAITQRMGGMTQRRAEEIARRLFSGNRAQIRETLNQIDRAVVPRTAQRRYSVLASQALSQPIVRENVE